MRPLLIYIVFFAAHLSHAEIYKSVVLSESADQLDSLTTDYRRALSCKAQGALKPCPLRPKSFGGPKWLLAQQRLVCEKLLGNLIQPRDLRMLDESILQLPDKCLTRIRRRLDKIAYQHFLEDPEEMKLLKRKLVWLEN